MAAEESEGRRGIGGWTLKHRRIRTQLLVSPLMPFCPFLFLCRHSSATFLVLGCGLEAMGNPCNL